MINDGALLFQGSFEDLKLKQSEKVVIEIETSNLSETCITLSALGLSLQINDSVVYIPKIQDEAIAKAVKALISRGVDVF